tara:strand:- start:214 stop:1356 length:1143 start_codon:yes stop_codon:yes gene_type:complete
MRLILINIFVLLILIICSELLLWQFLPTIYPIEQINNNQYIPSSHDANQKYHISSNEGLYGIDSNIIFTTNNFGFRGDNLTEEKNISEYRIFLIGGSTIENLYIDDLKSVEKRLQKKLQSVIDTSMQIKVLNAGKSGDISTDHLSMIAHRINHLKPNLIVLLCGINDFRRSINNYDYLHMPKKESAHISKMFKKVLTRYSQITRRVLILKNNINIDNHIEKITFITRHKQLFKNNQKKEEIRFTKQYSTKYYENNLKSIVGLCKINNISLILLTQPTTWNSKQSDEINKCHWMTYAENNKRYFTVDLQNGMKKFNDITKKISYENNVILLDLDKIIPPTEKYFFDDCHFNNEGVILTSELLSKIIIKNNLIQIRKNFQKN